MKRVEHFQVQSEDGTVLTVTKTSEKRSAHSLDGTVSYEGFVSYELEDGRKLTVIGNGKFQIQKSDTSLTQIS